MLAVRTQTVCAKPRAACWRVMNEDEVMGVTLAVVTYQRTDGLFRRFLTNLGELLASRVPPSEVIVINNDDPAFRRQVMEMVGEAQQMWASALTPKTGHWPPVRVVQSPQKNLAVARNAALTHASHEMLAFLDDDQRVDAQWLETLLTCRERLAADVVGGPVLCEFPPGAPLWLQRTDLHNTRGKSTGDRLPVLGTHNCLMSLTAVEGFEFDDRFGLSGGEDTDFFKRLDAAGVHLHWCAEAVATEWVIGQRATARYAVARFLSQGRTYRQMMLAGATPWRTVRFMAHAFFAAAAAGAFALLLVMGRHPSAGDWVKRCATNVGKLTYGQLQGTQYS